MRLHDALRNRETEAVTALLPRTGAIHPIEPLEDMRELPGWNLRARIVNRQQGLVLRLLQPQGDRTALVGIFYGIVQQDGSQAAKAILIPPDDNVICNLAHERFILLKSDGLKGQHAAPDHVAEIDLGERKRFLHV